LLNLIEHVFDQAVYRFHASVNHPCERVAERYDAKAARLSNGLSELHQHPHLREVIATTPSPSEVCGAQYFVPGYSPSFAVI